MKKLLQKYKNLIIKFGGNIARPRFGVKKKITKFLKIPYLLIEGLFEMVGDILFIWKRLGSKDISNPRKILIVKIDQFGDVLFSTFLLPIIKKSFPEVQIDYLVNKKTEFILKNNPYIKNIYHWDDPFLLFVLGRSETRNNIFRLLEDCLRRIKQIRKEKYDIIINTRAYPPSNNFFWKFMKPKYLISFDMSEQSFLSDIWAHYDMKGEEWKNYLNLIKPFCHDIKEIYEPGVYQFDDQGLKAVLPKIFNTQKRIIVISPVSFDIERYWPVDNWRSLLRSLIDRGFFIVLTGMPTQRKLLEDIIEESSDQIIFATNLSLPQLASLYKQAKYFIGIDSFPAHLAITLEKDSFCLVNERYYYLKGYSNKTWIDARCMLPLIDRVHIFSIEKSSPEDIVKLIKI